MEYALSILLGIAVLVPLLSFAIIFLVGPSLGKHGVGAAYVATGAILTAAVLSFISMVIWVNQHPPSAAADHGGEHAAHEHGDQGHSHEGDAAHDHVHDGEHAHDHEHAHDGEHAHGHGLKPLAYSGVYYTLAEFDYVPAVRGGRMTISYYIDGLTIAMFCMVTLIATCIHFYAIGYMHDELHDFTDHEVDLQDGSHLTRPGRFHRFFQYLSLFCFSMLGLVLAGNILMVFVFWELVGICSYFLIGFYVERKSASNAANKAFIVNRVGDFGMIIGLMAIWAGLGTFAFGDVEVVGPNGQTHVEQGIFSLVRPEGELITPRGMALAEADDIVDAIVREQVRQGKSDQEIAAIVDRTFDRFEEQEATRRELLAEATAIADEKRALSTSELQLIAAKRAEAAEIAHSVPQGGYGYWLLMVAGIGIFCGCVGKSAQFPLHVWLPDAMEGPTPVSALVHSATMVAAGVYLVGRFYPVFTPEVLLVIAIVGTITLLLAATIAVTATDIKRVLAYSTVSQLGYMMLALGVGGWVAGMMHLITHAFFKSLLFMCSGSVIHAVHTNEMTEMGGLRKKMPYTAYTMLIGCLAIAGAGVPFLVGFSGYYSKDAILEQAFSLMTYGANPAWAAVFFWAAAGGAAITAFYMFRLWYMTFAGTPRNRHRYDHAHESPKVMYVPLLVLSAFAIGVAWRVHEAWWAAGIFAIGALAVVLRALFAKGDREENLSSARKIAMVSGMLVLLIVVVSVAWRYTGNFALADLLEQARPPGTLVDVPGALVDMTWPDEHAGHAPEIKVPVTILASLTALGGFLLATMFYGWRLLNPGDVKSQFSAIHRLLVNKYYFDEFYDWMFVKPTHVLGAWASAIDRLALDWLIDNTAKGVRWFAQVWERLADQIAVDGFVNLVASWTYSTGLSMRGAQRGHLREYVVYIVVGTLALFMLISFSVGVLLAG